MFEPLFKKEAEPPPPEGVSSKEWDKTLAKGKAPCCVKTAAPVALIKKIAEAQAFEELTSPRAPLQTTESIIRQEKLGSVEDSELFKTASGLFEMDYPRGSVDLETRVNGTLEYYEQLGGKYKHAFGTPMFNSQQMTGSPALAGGMGRRASTSMPTAPQAQPQQSPAKSSPQAQANGVTSAPSSAAQTPAPSATSASSAVPSVSMG